ncbi:MAG: arsenite methyltransferase [Gammaproteobacteria bacterium]|nr:arsenite methyltransferase [Gammaproteobacteria bacterium]
MLKQTHHEKIRSAVSTDYAKAVNTPSSAACCGGKGAQKGVVAKLAGYTDEELATLPTEAVANSFGCGNPLAFSEVKSGDVVLDLGSGAGIDLLIAARKVGPRGRVIGVDMTDEMLAKANENIAASKLNNVQVRKGIIEDLPVETASVDWVISNCVINLSPEKPKVFKEIFRVLRQGGTMSISDIVAEELPEEIKNNRALLSSCMAGAISEKDYIAGLKAAGLVDIKVKNRLIYDTNQLKEFIGSELKETREDCCCTHDGSDSRGESLTELADKWAHKLARKVWSIKITAKKP